MSNSNSRIKMKEKRLKVRTNSFINSSNRLTSTCHHQVIYLVCRECQQTQPFQSCPWAWHCFFTWNMILSYLLAQNHRRCYVSNQTRQRHDTSHNSVHPVSDQPEVFFVVNRKCGTFCKETKKEETFRFHRVNQCRKISDDWLLLTNDVLVNVKIRLIEKCFGKTVGIQEGVVIVVGRKRQHGLKM